MSTFAQPPAPQPRLRLPNHRHMSQLGFVLGAAGGAISYLVHEGVVVALFVFALVWYAVSYAVVRVADHPARRVAWVAHVVILPVTAVIGIVAAEYAWDGQFFGAALIGLVGGAFVQLLVTHTLLRGVAADQRQDLRHRLGLE